MDSNQSKLQETPSSHDKAAATMPMSGIMQLSDDEYVHIETGARELPGRCSSIAIFSGNMLNGLL